MGKTDSSSAPLIDPHAIAAQRIDKWLWHARFFKTRTLAARFVSAGSIRLSRNADAVRVEKPGTDVKAGDVISFVLNERVRIIEIIACGPRRGPASEAQRLYNDQSPPPPTKQARDLGLPNRDAGAGRPTKKDRRALDALRDND